MPREKAGDDLWACAVGDTHLEKRVLKSIGWVQAELSMPCIGLSTFERSGGDEAMMSGSRYVRRRALSLKEIGKCEQDPNERSKCRWK